MNILNIVKYALVLLVATVVAAHLLPHVKRVLDMVFGLIGGAIRVVVHFPRWIGTRIEAIIESLKAKVAKRHGEHVFEPSMIVSAVLELTAFVVAMSASVVFLADQLGGAKIGTGEMTSGSPVLFAALLANVVALWKTPEALWGPAPADGAPVPPRLVAWAGLISVLVFDASLAVITVIRQNGGDPGRWTMVPRIAFVAMLASVLIITGMRLFGVADAVFILLLGLARAVLRAVEVAVAIAFFLVDLVRKLLFTVLSVLTAIGRGFWNWCVRNLPFATGRFGEIPDPDLDDLVDVVDPIIFGILPFLDPDGPGSSGSRPTRPGVDGTSGDDPEPEESSEMSAA